MSKDFFTAIKPALNELKDFEIFDSLSEIRQDIVDINYNGFKSFQIKYGNNLNYVLIADLLDFLIVNSVIYSRDYSAKVQKTLKNQKDRQRVIQKILTVYQDVFQFNGQDKNWLFYRGILERQDDKRYCQNVFSLIHKCLITFGDDRVRSHIENTIQMPYKDFLNLGQLLYFYFSRQDKICFSFSKSWFLNIPSHNRDKFMTDDNLNKMFGILSCNIKDYRQFIKNEVKYDNENIFNIHSIAYNRYPLIEKNNILYCHTPDKILSQISDGIYHIANIPQLCLSENNIATLIGEGFENFIGELLSLINTRSRFSILKEVTFGKPQKKTSDWIVIDDDCIMFLECKTKRIKNDSRSQLEIVDNLEKDLRAIANGIAKMFVVIKHYEQNNIDKIPFNSLKMICPVMVTFEDYYFNTKEFYDEIKKMTIEKLEEKKVDPEIVDRLGFYLYSAADFEIDFQIMENRGLSEYFKLQNAGKITFEFKESFNPQKVFFVEHMLEFRPNN